MRHRLSCSGISSSDSHGDAANVAAAEPTVLHTQGYRRATVSLLPATQERYWIHNYFRSPVTGKVARKYT